MSRAAVEKTLGVAIEQAITEEFEVNFEGIQGMGRRRLRTDSREPLPQGLYKVERQYRARLPGGSWRYFGTDYVSAVSGYAAWSHSGRIRNQLYWKDRS